MAVQIQQLGSPGNLPDLLAKLKNILQDLEDQINSTSQTVVTDSIPRTGANGTVYVNPYGDFFTLAVATGNTMQYMNPGTLGALYSRGTNFVGLKEGGTVPTLDEFPNDNDWGFFYDFPSLYIAYNKGGSVFYTTI